MKQLLTILSISALLFSCNSTGSEKDRSEQVVEQGPPVTDTLKSFEEEIDKVAVGGEGVVFEKDGMSFDIESLESSVQKLEQQLNHIREKYDYETEEQKKSAIHSMELNMKLFTGEFCCTTHNGKHCADSKALRPLKAQYGCDRFMKKK